MKLCKPLRSPRQTAFIAVFTVVFVLVSAVSAHYFPDIALYLRIAGGVFLLTGVALLCRFAFTEYVYALSGNVFSVRRTTGFSESTVFELVLTGDTKLCTKRQFRKRSTSGGRSYRQNLTAATAFLVYTRAGSARYVEFEPNAGFFSLVSDAIELQKRQ